MSRLLLLFCFVLASCTPVTTAPELSEEEIKAEADYQKQLVLKYRFEEEERVFNIAHGILQAGQGFCGEKRAWTVGLHVWNIRDFDFSKYQDYAREMYNLDRGIRVKYVFDGFAAKEAGIQKGDQIIAVEGERLKPTSDALKSFQRKVNASTGDTLRLTIRRDRMEREYELKKELICDYPVRYRHRDLVRNAWTNGKSITITRGYYDFTRNDEELAEVLAHELSHIIMRHIDKKAINSAIGWTIGAIADYGEAAMMDDDEADDRFRDGGWFAGMMAFSPQFEVEADYLGYYIMARAGYDLEKSLDVQRRHGALAGELAIEYETTHPRSTERFLLMQRALDEIRKKQEQGAPLIPNYDPQAWSAKHLKHAHDDAYND